MNKITEEFITKLFVDRDPLFYGIAWKILKNEADVEECTQDLCVHAFEKCVDRKVTTSPRKYMAVVSWHFAIEFKRKKDSMDIIEDEILTIDHSIEVLEAEEFLTFCILQLSANDQNIVSTQMTELTSSQCAKKLGITESAGQRKLSPARKRLEKKIKQFSSDDRPSWRRTPDLESFSGRKTCETNSHVL